MKTFLFFLLMWSTLVAQEQWHAGVVVLADEQVRNGELSFLHDVLLMRTTEGISVLPAHRVSSFRYYDKNENINHHYQAIPDPRTPLHHKRYYEVVAWGDVSIVRRMMHPLLSKMKDEIVYYDYFSWYGSELHNLKKFKVHLYPMIQENGSMEMKNFIIREHLNPGRMADVIRMVKFYNQQCHARISMAAL